MRRLLVLCALGALVAAAALDDQVETRIEDVCRGDSNRTIVCTCSPQHPEIDVVSADTGFLSHARLIKIEHCPVVKLVPYSLEMTIGLEQLSLVNVSRLSLLAPLPVTLKNLILSRIGELAPIPEFVFQVPRNMNALIMQNVIFEGLEPNFLRNVRMNLTKITGCTFPNISSDSLHIESHQVVIKGNNFSSLDAGALVLKSENATLSDNCFEALVSGSIQWHPWPQGLNSKLSFERNSFESLEFGALTRLKETGNSTVSDNALLCSAEEFNSCKEKAASSGLKVCDAEDVCRYQKRNELTKVLAKERRCSAGIEQITGECAVLLVGGAGASQAASSVAVAAALLLVTWFAT